MNPSTLTPEQIHGLASQLMLQFGTVLFLVIAFLVASCVILPCVIFNLRRCALGGFALFGALTFLVPTPVTLYFSPFVVLVSLAAIAWITISGRQRASALPTESPQPRHQAASAAP